MPPRFQDDLLHRHLQALLGSLEPDALMLLARSLEGLRLRGDPARERMVRERACGQTIGDRRRPGPGLDPWPAGAGAAWCRRGRRRSG